MDRKAFIKTCSLACIGSTAIGMFFQSCSTINYVAKYNLVGDKLQIKKTEFIKINNEATKYAKYVVVRPVQLSFPICVFRISEKEYTALLMKCTHRSCELHNQGDYLMCPCHGSEFSNKGVVQNPPADQNLKSFQITTDNEYVYIQL